MITKTLRRECEDLLKDYHGDPEYKDIARIRLAIIKLAQAIDNIHEYGKF